MPNVVLISDSLPAMAAVQRAIMLQSYKVESLTHHQLSKLPRETDIIYAEVSNDDEHLETLEYLRAHFLLTPTVAFIPLEKIDLAIKSIRCGASDILHLSGEQVRDSIEVVNSIYRAMRKRQSLLSTERLLHHHETISDDAGGMNGGAVIAIGSDELTTDFFHQMRQAVVMLDSKAAVVSLNHSAENMIGQREGDMRGKDISLFINIAPEDKEKVLRLGHEHRGEMIIRQDNQNVTIGYSLSPQRQEGRITGAMMMFKDITQDKQQRMKAEKAEKIQTLGEIAAAISHEVKNPLAGIKSMVQAVLLDVSPSTETYHYIKRISQEVDRINAFIENTFAFARHKRPRVLKVDIANVISSVSSLLAENLRSQKIELVRTYEPNLPGVKIDPDQMHQVILNIMLNAIEAISLAAREMVREKKLEVVAQQTVLMVNGEAKPFLEVLFHDSGPGISEANLAKLFDPFFTTKPSGTGLGLAISYKIVTEHQGYIDIANREGGGTTVSLKLPLAPTSRFHS